MRPPGQPQGGSSRSPSHAEQKALKYEVRKLRHKVETLEKEKEEMVDNFRVTTKVLLERIKSLEAQLSASSRPQTAAVLARIEDAGAGSVEGGMTFGGARPGSSPGSGAFPTAAPGATGAASGGYSALSSSSSPPLAAAAAGRGGDPPDR